MAKNIQKSSSRLETLLIGANFINTQNLNVIPGTKLVFLVDVLVVRDFGNLFDAMCLAVKAAFDNIKFEKFFSLIFEFFISFFTFLKANYCFSKKLFKIFDYFLKRLPSFDIPKKVACLSLKDVSVLGTRSEVSLINSALVPFTVTVYNCEGKFFLDASGDEEEVIYLFFRIFLFLAIFEN